VTATPQRPSNGRLISYPVEGGVARSEVVSVRLQLVKQVLADATEETLNADLDHVEDLRDHWESRRTASVEHIRELWFGGSAQALSIPG